ncbi:MAG: hypothetical protein ACXWZ2_00390 [Mycobacterium sp.]
MVAPVAALTTLAIVWRFVPPKRCAHRAVSTGRASFSEIFADGIVGSAAVML